MFLVLTRSPLQTLCQSKLMNAFDSQAAFPGLQIGADSYVAQSGILANYSICEIMPRKGLSQSIIPE